MHIFLVTSLYFTLHAHLDVSCKTIHPVSSFKTHVSAAGVPLSIAKCALNVDDEKENESERDLFLPLSIAPFVKSLFAVRADNKISCPIETERVRV